MRGEPIELYTSHWRSPLLADVDATMVSISRGQPRWRLPFRYRKLSELAPNKEAWAMKNRESFEAAYGRQLEALGAEWILESLAAIGDGAAVCLLCWEKPGDPWCHRRMLAAWLHTRTGILVPELRAGDLPQREDPAELRLLDREERR